MYFLFSLQSNEFFFFSRERLRDYNNICFDFVHYIKCSLSNIACHICEIPLIGRVSIQKKNTKLTPKTEKIIDLCQRHICGSKNIYTKLTPVSGQNHIYFTYIPRTEGNFIYIPTYMPRVRGYIQQYSPQFGIYVFFRTSISGAVSGFFCFVMDIHPLNGIYIYIYIYM